MLVVASESYCGRSWCQYEMFLAHYFEESRHFSEMWRSGQWMDFVSLSVLGWPQQIFIALAFLLDVVISSTTKLEDKLLILSMMISHVAIMLVSPFAAWRAPLMLHATDSRYILSRFLLTTSLCFLHPNEAIHRLEEGWAKKANYGFRIPALPECIQPFFSLWAARIDPPALIDLFQTGVESGMLSEEDAEIFRASIPTKSKKEAEEDKALALKAYLDFLSELIQSLEKRQADLEKRQADYEAKATASRILLPPLPQQRFTHSSETIHSTAASSAPMLLPPPLCWGPGTGTFSTFSAVTQAGSALLLLPPTTSLVGPSERKRLLGYSVPSSHNASKNG